MYLNLNSIISSKKLLLFTITTAFLFIEAKGQLREGYKADIEVQAIGTTNGVVPFWMRSNQFGSIPLSGVSGSVIGRFSKDYSQPTPNEEIYGRHKLVDWGFGLEGRANGGKSSNAQLIQAYAKGKLSIFELKLGRTKDVMGLNGDTVLSSGNFAVSGNALGIPKVELSIPEYWRLPILDGIFSFKGNFVHGWIGHAKILDSIEYYKGPSLIINNNSPVTYFHQKSLYARLGKEDWRLKLYGGFNHQVYWGNEDAAYGPKFQLSSIETFFYVATGKAYGENGLPRSKIGNQLGSIDLGLEYDFGNVNIMVYRQNFYDVGALSKLANINDGLNGITFRNNDYYHDTNGFKWKKILFEVFYSKDQAGYPWSTPTASGDEDYYNNYYYVEGWTYKNIGLGNPLITRKEDAKEGQATRKNDYFINNRVIALHFGMEGAINQWQFLTKFTYSWNHGTFGSSKYGNSTGNDRYPQTYDLFVPNQQLSVYIDASRELNNGITLGLNSAFDQGQLLNNSFGFQIRAMKRF